MEQCRKVEHIQSFGLFSLLLSIENSLVDKNISILVAKLFLLQILALKPLHLLIMWSHK